MSIETGPADFALLQSELIELRTRIRQMEAEFGRLVAHQQELMKLIGARSPDLILHDIRNLLNKVVLLESASSSNS